LTFGYECVSIQLVPEPIYRDFGRRLRNARKSAKLTQEALALRVGLTRTSITNIEQGNQHVGLHLLYDLAKAVGAAPAGLLPDEAAVKDDGDLVGRLAAGRRRSERKQIELQLKQLTHEDQEKLLRLINKEAATK
jgi:transcriptional regulator with XRE-family HTH domain